MGLTLGAGSIVAGLTSHAAASCGQLPGFSNFLLLYRDAVVKIETSGGPDRYCVSAGSGFLVGTKGNLLAIVSAAHVIPTHPECKGKLTITARFPQKPTATFELQERERTPQDIVLLSADLKKVEPLLGKPLELCQTILGNAGSPVEPLVFLGYYDRDIDPTPYAGHIETKYDGSSRQRICGTANNTISGAPVFDGDGKIIGMMRERIERDSFDNPVVGKAWIVPVNTVQDLLNRWGLVPIKKRCGIETASFQPTKVFGDLISALLGPMMLEKRISQITVPYQISDIRNDFEPAPPGAIARWRAARERDPNTPPLRFARTYEKRFVAEPGFRIDAVREVRVVSRSLPPDPLPSAQCDSLDDCIRVSEDRRSLIVNYRLWSGARDIDNSRGWIDLIVNTLQSRAR